MPAKNQVSGFTLVELLIGTVVGGIVLSGALSLLNYTFQISQKELAQTDTQRELQLTLNFVATDLREAVYVYGGNCLQGQGSLTNGVPTSNFCPGIINSVPTATLTSSIPLLAFWKLTPLPPTLQTACANNTASASVSCTTGRSYTLVVYFLSKANSTQWGGKARLVRYYLSQYDQSGNLMPNYVAPNKSGVNFKIWPYQQQGSTLVNLQSALPTSNAENTTVISDFIDDTERISLGDNNVTCDSGYEVSPGNQTLHQFAVSPDFDPTHPLIRSFYACVKGVTAVNQDNKLFVRANARGKAGIETDFFLPTLETRILSQGILDASPLPMNQ